MKQRKLVIAGVAAAVVVLCAVIFFIRGKSDAGDVGYSAAVQDSDYAGDAGSDSVREVTKDPQTDGTDAKSGTGNEEEGSDASRAEERKVLLTDQLPDHGSLSKKTEKKLLDRMTEGRPAVILDCPEVPEPERMKIYKKKKMKIRSAGVRKKLEALLCEAVKDNPGHETYHPLWLPDDFQGEVGAFGEGEGSSQSSAEEPYVAITPKHGRNFILAKEWYDTRIAIQDRFSLTQKRAVTKTKRFLCQLISELALGCGLASTDTWTIQGISTDSADHIPLSYQNGMKENYYVITAYCTLDGYPVAADIVEEDRAKESDYFYMYYSESGWSYMNGMIPHVYRDTGKYYENILSLRDIQRKLVKALKKENAMSAYGVTEAQLGYVATKKEIRPAWILYGEKKSLEGGTGRYLLDAVTGEVLAWEKSWE